VTQLDWIGAALAAARPQVVAALLRRFKNLDMAEEAYQEACLRALKTWPVNGPPRDLAGWLIMVGRNSAVDTLRRSLRQEALPADDALSDLSDAETAAAEQIDESHYRDDILRLLFVCCHPELPAAHQIALALRIVSGLSVAEIASAFLVSHAAMEQRITRAKKKIALADVSFEPPGAVERSERLAAVATTLYLLFNEGYAASGGKAHVRSGLCDEAIRLARLLLRMFPAEPEIMGLTALMLLQHARTPARVDAAGEIVLLEDQDRTLWDRARMAEGFALLDKAMRHAQPGPYQVQAAIAALHARAVRAADTDWVGIEMLYAMLEAMLPSPVVALNRAVATSKARGPEEALTLLEALGSALDGYFYFHGVKGGLLKELGRESEAREAFERAIALARSPAEAAHIRMQLDHLARSSRAEKTA
jgi:RNA polymerase sigma-70 factor (ECF subfamily)